MDSLTQQVRAGDYDRFLAIQLAPASMRGALYTLAAFHLELARIAEIVSEPLIGHIRLAWWHEALQEIETGKVPRNHPVVQALADIYANRPIIFGYLHAIIDARGADLDPSQLAEESAWRNYCAETAGNLHIAMAHLISAEVGAHEPLIRAYGQAYAMIGLMQAIPFMAAHNIKRLPATFSDVSPTPTLYTRVHETVATALSQLPVIQPPRELKTIRALAALTHLHARQLRARSYNPYTLRPARVSAVWQVMRVNII
jgi:phytoene/squalene synthetase